MVAILETILSRWKMPISDIDAEFKLDVSLEK